MLVKVWNDNIYDYSEKFRGNLISIPAKQFIEMDEDDAHNFKVAFTFPHKDEQGRPDPRHFKKIRIEFPEDYRPLEPDPLVVHATGQKAASVEQLAKILESLSDRLVKDEEGDREVAKKNRNLKKENDDLKARLKLIEERLGISADGVTDGT